MEINSMDNIIANIFDLADYADNFGHVNLAKKLDAHANSLLNIKIAQYVGGQGYAVRNSRCWSNCYRQKRAQKPEMPAQLVWQDCHKEYVDSINKDGSNWDKYASGFNFIKTSQKDEIAHEIYQMKFAQVIDEQLASGATYAFAIENATQKFNDILNEQYNQILP
jgi:hypothetical protein